MSIVIASTCAVVVVAAVAVVVAAVVTVVVAVGTIILFKCENCQIEYVEKSNFLTKIFLRYFIFTM